jgi:hypothetical protein
MIITQFPLPSRCVPCELSFSYFDKHNEVTVEIKFQDEGAGYFVKIIAESTITLDAKDLTEIAKWCGDVCDALDKEMDK